MGDPRKQRKKFSGPTHPWQRVRLDEERQLVDSYGLKKKTELWKHISFLRHIKKQAKALISRRDPQAEKEKGLLIKRLYGLGMVQENATLDNVLELTTPDILNRRLQTVVHARKMANTHGQARQFITHQHIVVGEKKIDVPSYLVKRAEEIVVSFDPTSALADEDHPERAKQKVKETQQIAEKARKEKKAEKKEEPAKVEAV